MPVARPLLIVVFCSALAGCGGFSDSGLNPFNWFGNSEPRETIVLPEEQSDPRPLVQTVQTMTVEPVPGGAIVRATGQTPTQGWWAAELVPLPVDENDTLVYEFRLLPPIDRSATGAPRTREVEVAIYISDYKLDAAREIVVQGSGNARSARR
jgi:hypothetical protein